MISPFNQELLAQAVEAVRERRANTAAAAMQQQQTSQAQGFDMAKTKMGLSAKSKMGAKPGAAKKAATKKTAAKKPAATQASMSDISPYLDSDDLMSMADRGQADDTAVANTNFMYETAAATALRDAGDVERGRVKNVSGANDDAASRGLYNSGIRAGNVGMANSDAARNQSEIVGALSVQKAKQQADLAGIAQGRAEFSQAMIARAAENGMALPVDPYDGGGASPSRAKAAQAQRKSPSQNGAANVKGAATLSKKKLVQASGFAPLRRVPKRTAAGPVKRKIKVSF